MYKFSKEIAMVCGINAALIAQFIDDTIRSEEAKNHDDRSWCRCSILMITGHFPFLTRHMVADALEKLVAANVIKKGCFNRNSFDHTNWYTFTEYGKLLLSKEIEKAPKVACCEPNVVLDMDGQQQKKCSGCVYYDREKMSCGVCVKDILGEVKEKYPINI